MSAPLRPAAQTILPLPDLLLRLSAQLHAMHSTGQALEEVVGDLIAHGQGSATAFLAPLQGFDHLVQQIEALSLLLRDLSAEVPPEIAVDATAALRKVRLRGLAAALSAGGIPADACTPHDFGGGDAQRDDGGHDGVQFF